MHVDDWHSLTTDELRARVDNASVAVLPVAAIEQHGPHLPLSTDVDIGNGILAAARALLTKESDATGRVFVLPNQAVAASTEHNGFAGTLCISAEQLIDYLTALGESLVAAGIRRLVIFNSHGGNRAAIDIAALRLRQRAELLVVKANYFRFPVAADVLPQGSFSHDIHGGALETAMMRHLAPESVREPEIAALEPAGERAENNGWMLLPEGPAGCAWRAEDLSPSGIGGNPTQGSAELGARLVAGHARYLADLVRQASIFDASTWCPDDRKI